MTKNLKLSFILLFVVSAIIIAWRNLTKILGGTGLIFVALLTLVSILLGIILTDKTCFKRIKDLFFTACALTILETIVYFAFEFPVEPSYSAIKGFLVFQNIICVFAILFFAYTTFRFICEAKEIKLGFIEFILGNKSSNKKVKKSKEIFNGSLEDKPIYLKETQAAETVDTIETPKQETFTQSSNEETLSSTIENYNEETEQTDGESDSEE